MVKKVEKMCKNPWKSMFKTWVKFCGLKFFTRPYVQNLNFAHTFEPLFTSFSTINSSQSLINNFHYSTMPITTITTFLYNNKERNFHEN